MARKKIGAFPEMGIGQVFDYYLREVVFVENHAMNGRSTKSFLAEGRLDAIAERIKPGDFVFIQFGHNDEKIDKPERYASVDVDYPANLARFVAVARERGATPVILSSIVRRIMSDDGTLGTQTHAEYAAAAKQFAKLHDVAFIDLFALSGDLLVEAGPELTKQWFMHLAPGEYPNYPDGLTDNTHLRLPGALAFGALVAEGLKRLGGKYADLVCG